ncbi:MAG: hypothetical protein HC850_01375 [Rhodomicrobium sp.]|nr:hypothetical protein [Rhodomicrobium sp.]
MNEAARDAVSGSAATIIGLGLLKRAGRLRSPRRERQSPPLEKTRRPAKANIVLSLIKVIVYLGLLVAYLIVEVLAAMLGYMYLNLYHIETFGQLIRVARQLLNAFAVQLERISPDLATQAYATLLGELGPKAVLLLFIGLGVSMVIRVLIWMFHKGVDTVRPRPSA